MIHIAYYCFVGKVPSPLFFPLFDLAFVVEFEEDQDPPFFFHASEQIKIKRSMLAYGLALIVYVFCLLNFEAH